MNRDRRLVFSRAYREKQDIYLSLGVNFGMNFLQHFQNMSEMLVERFIKELDRDGALES